MQPSALRAAWALQNARGPLPSALQQALTLLTHASIPDTNDAPAPSSTSLSATDPGLNRSLNHLSLRPITTSAAAPTSSSSSFSSSPCAAPDPAPAPTWDRRHSSTLAAPAAAQHQPPSPSSSSPSPSSPAPLPTGAYAIEIAVTGFEKRYVDMACNTIDDLLMLAFAPKALAALPVGSPAPADAPLSLAFGAIRRRDVRLPWRRTRFTLLRSPHIDKQGMEQFERREYKTVLSAATHSDEELRRLLEALKIYQFTGVKIQLDVTSAQRLELPQELTRLLRGGAGGGAAASGGGGGAAGVLGAPAVTLPAPHSAETRLAGELAAALRVLRPLVAVGLQARRAALDKVPEFTAWRMRTTAAGGAARPPQPAGAEVEEADAADGGGGNAYGRLLRQRMQQQLALMRAAASPSEATASAAAYGLDPATAAELLARIDSELLNAREDALQGQPPPPPPPPAAAAAPSAATAAPPPPALDASKMSPAEYAYAVLKYVQYVDALAEEMGRGRGPAEAGAEAADAADSDVALQLSAPGLALRLLQLWCAATSAEFKAALGLPPPEVEKQILEEQRRREEMARAAAALAAKPAGGTAAPPAPPAPAATPGAAGQGQGQGQGRPQVQGQGRWQRQGEGQGPDRAEGPRRGQQHQQQQQQQPRRGPGGQGGQSGRAR